MAKVDLDLALNDLRAGRLARPARLSLWLAAALAFVPTPALSAGDPLAPVAPVTETIVGGQSIEDFYVARGWQPLWLRPDGSAGVEAMMLLDLLRTSDADGLDPNRYPVRDLARAIRSARSGSPEAVRRTEHALSEAFVAYVGDLKQVRDVGIAWVDPGLKPTAPSPRALLASAARAPSLETYLASLGWMHPIYAGLRNAIASGGAADQSLLRLNLERARVLPAASSGQKYVVVNAAAARLTMYEGGDAIDTMRVVVGRPVHATPMMAAYIRYTSLNPYWNVPPDLAAERIAPNVIKGGTAYLAKQKYQLLSDWSDEPEVSDPASVDWQAVADGTKQIRLRQLPGPANAMGKMKFMFPNPQGVYLHDTPDKQLLTEASRMFSGGCVRLEDAERLATWLYGRPIEASSSKPELRVDLPHPIAVYLTYLTAVPTGTEIARFDDVYGRDRQALAESGTPAALAAR